jgi:type I phosphodiesterase/nucleotide pyrophosphatase
MSLELVPEHSSQTKHKNHLNWLLVWAIVMLFVFPASAQTSRHGRRLVILKVDGMGADLLYSTMREIDPATGKSKLPWLTKIFSENGTIFENFYTRGISLSAPSWSMLDTGRRSIIRGNVEYDRFTGYVYDYLNFFPFYLGYAHRRHMDMPAVEVLERAGIPLIVDYYPYAQVLQNFQLFQRGVRWTTLQRALKQSFSTKALLSMVEDGGGPPLNETLQQQLEDDAKTALHQPETFYVDYFTGEVDHLGHATNQPAAMLSVLKHVDALAGRLWTAIQASSLAAQTMFVVVSDHGMNNVPGIFSQSFNLPDLFNSPAGGAHHVITNRHQLQDYKLVGLDPLVSRVTNASNASFYLNGQAAQYPTAWLDLDGNERAFVQLRNSDLNKIHILLQNLAQTNLSPGTRKAVADCLLDTINRHRAAWTKTASELDEELRALGVAVEEAKKEVAARPKKWTEEDHNRGRDKAADRIADRLQDWQEEQVQYSVFLARLRALLAFQPDPIRPLKQKISELVPEMALGDNNTVADLEHYIVGPGEHGPVVDAGGRLDEQQSFRYINYFPLLASQRVRNNPQAALSPKPIDFMAMRLPENAYWLYGDEDSQLLIQVDHAGRIAAKPVGHLEQNADGQIRWQPGTWRPGLPLHLFEDPELHLPAGVDRASWLSEWHTEQEWMTAIHRCQYSNGLIGVVEELSPMDDDIPGPKDINPILLRYERRRRELVQADFHIFAADHWNFNARNSNPGGNHGSFLRISTHSVWMMSGQEIAPHREIEQPYDSLNFASTLLDWCGFTPPLPDRVVPDYRVAPH